MTSKKLKKLMAKLKAGLLTSQEQLVHYDDLKAAFMELSEEQSKSMAQKNPQTFSSWPPEMPERKCSWRQNDLLQELRLRVPEPYDCKRNSVMKFSPINLKRRAFETEDGSTFYAWTADGRTPIFPIPL